MGASGILVPLDGTESAMAALPVAKVLGEIEQAALRLVNFDHRNLADAELVRRLRLEGLEPDGFTIDSCTGEEATEILRVAQKIRPTMIVLCKHRAAEPQEALGSTASEVLRQSSFPLVLVSPERGMTPWRLQHVLVPHDATPSTSGALRPAIELAEHAGAEVLVAHVTGTRGAPAEPGSFTPSPYVDQPQHEWPAWSREFVQRIACLCPIGHLHVRLLLARGNPAAELLRLVKAQSTDLIVLVWRGMWEAPRAAILKAIVGGARCPVMVVRA